MTKKQSNSKIFRMLQLAEMKTQNAEPTDENIALSGLSTDFMRLVWSDENGAIIAYHESGHDILNFLNLKTGISTALEPEDLFNKLK